MSVLKFANNFAKAESLFLFLYNILNSHPIPIINPPGCDSFNIDFEVLGMAESSVIRHLL